MPLALPLTPFSPLEERRPSHLLNRCILANQCFQDALTIRLQLFGGRLSHVAEFWLAVMAVIDAIEHHLALQEILRLVAEQKCCILAGLTNFSIKFR